MEYITTNVTRYECQTVRTEANQIAFEMQGQEISAVSSAFKEVTALIVSPEEGAAYGSYENLIFESATVYENGSIQVIMHIPDATELRLAALEATQTEQDVTLAGIMFGGEAE